MTTQFISRSGIASQFIALAVLVLLCGLGSLNASAQDTSTSTSAPAATHEITVAGTIQQVIPTNNTGVQVTLLTPQGIFTTDLGPSLRQDVKNALTAGQQIQITGTVQNINGQTVLLARLLTFSDRLVIVRNEHGFPVHTTAGTLAAAMAIQNGDVK
jgi:hypothetical protein